MGTTRGKGADLVGTKVVFWIALSIWQKGCSVDYLVFSEVGEVGSSYLWK